MHTISSYGGNRPTNKQDRLQYTVLQPSTQCNKQALVDNNTGLQKYMACTVQSVNPGQSTHTSIKYFALLCHL